MKNVLWSFHVRGLMAERPPLWIPVLAVSILLMVGSASAASGVDDGIRLFQQEKYVESAKILLPLAEAGDARAQFYMGVMYHDGVGVPRDFQKSVEMYKKAASQGHVRSMYFLAVAYRACLGTRCDREKALKWFQSAAERGDRDAILELGDAYRSGFDGVKRDYGKALEQYELARKKGHKCADQRIGEMYIGVDPLSKDYPLRRDYKKALSKVRSSAMKGCRRAMVRLAEFYEKGQIDRYDETGIVRVDEEKAFQWRLRAAEKGDVYSGYLVGESYVEGKGVKRDVREGLRWLERLAKRGHVLSLYKLAVMYESGQGVLQDYKRAANLYEECVERDYQNCFYGMGRLFRFGWGVEKDVDAATSFYLASLKGLALKKSAPLFELGNIYLNGENGKRNAVVGYAFFNVAAAQNDNYAEEAILNARRKAAMRLDREEMVKAQALSKELKEKVDSLFLVYPVNWQVRRQIVKEFKEIIAKYEVTEKRKGQRKESKERPPQGQDAEHVVNQYMSAIRQKVDRNWIEPATSRSGLSCLVKVTLGPDGEVEAVQIADGSGDAAFDRSAEAAVYRASPLPVPKDARLFKRFQQLTFRFRPR